MYIYFSILALSFSSLFFPKEYSRYILFLLGVFFTLFVGFRHEVGADWDTYLIIFDLAGSFDDPIDTLMRVDGLYYFINWIGYNYDLEIYFVNTVCAIIFLYGLTYLSRHQYHSILGFVISIPYLVFVVSMGYTRQSAALGLFFLAIVALIQKRDKLFLFWVFLAVQFHFSAIIFLSLLIIRISQRKLLMFSWLILPICILAVFFLKNVFSNKLELYTDGGIDSKGALLRLGFNLIPSLFFIYKRKWFKRNMIESYQLMLLLSVGSMFVFFVSPFLSTMADRMGLYFSVIQILVYSNIAKIFKPSGLPLFYLGLLLFYSVFLIIWFNFSFFAKEFWLPYENILF